jgi:hypothetical protein
MLRKACFAAVAVTLAGCGGGSEFDGVYVGTTGYVTAAVMTLKGGEAKLEAVDRRKHVVEATTFMEAEVKAGKLMLREKEGRRQVYVYGLDVDEQSLKCLSDNCQSSFGSMPNKLKLAKQ